jgi:hypothetical protein
MTYSRSEMRKIVIIEDGTGAFLIRKAEKIAGSVEFKVLSRK